MTSFRKELVNDNDLMGNYQKSKELAIDLELSNLKDKRLELESKIESGQIDEIGEIVEEENNSVDSDDEWDHSVLDSDSDDDSLIQPGHRTI